jgi:peptidoglycan/LPS O-acetylase OafA/YrhL
MPRAPTVATLFEQLEGSSAPPGIGLRVWRAATTGAFLLLSLILLVGACAFAFGPSRTFFDPTLVPKAIFALLGLAALRRLAGQSTERWSAPARAVLSLLFLFGAFCFVNEAWSFVRRGL